MNWLELLVYSRDRQAELLRTAREAKARRLTPPIRFLPMKALVLREHRKPIYEEFEDLKPQTDEVPGDPR